MNRPSVLVIAGFDPSGGAGLIADAKTIETIGANGVFVQSCNTVQNDLEFKKCHWTKEAIIWDQLDIIRSNYTPSVVKIGLLKSSDFLIHLLEYLNDGFPDAKIIWDPIIRSSSGFSFHLEDHFTDLDKNTIRQLDMITPNYHELLQLTNENDFTIAVDKLSKYTRVYLKGGHRKVVGTDELYQPLLSKKSYPPTLDHRFEKHGSGCVISSAIAAYYALGKSWEESCQLAKIYVDRYLASSNTLIGKHSN